MIKSIKVKNDTTRFHLVKFYGDITESNDTLFMESDESINGLLLYYGIKVNPKTGLLQEMDANVYTQRMQAAQNKALSGVDPQHRPAVQGFFSKAMTVFKTALSKGISIAGLLSLGSLVIGAATIGYKIKKNGFEPTMIELNKKLSNITNSIKDKIDEAIKNNRLKNLKPEELGKDVPSNMKSPETTNIPTNAPNTISSRQEAELAKRMNASKK